VKLVTIDGRFAGIIAVADEGKQSWNAAVTRLKKMGMEVIMFNCDLSKVVDSIHISKASMTKI